MGCRVFKGGIQNYFWPKIKGNYCFLWIDVVASCQKLGFILENKVSQKLKLSKNAFQKNVLKKVRKIPLIFDIKIDFESQIWHFLTICHYVNSPNSIIPLRICTDFWPKICLILYPSLENSTTHITSPFKRWSSGRVISIPSTFNSVTSLIFPRVVEFRDESQCSYQWVVQGVYVLTVEFEIPQVAYF